jgi:hypothetical protein
VITIRTEFSDHRDEFPITRKLKTRFCDRAGDKEWPKTRVMIFFSYVSAGSLKVGSRFVDRM